jgi:hypothetical protein
MSRSSSAGAPAAWLAGAEARFAIVETATGDCAGSLGLRMTVPAFRIAEIGYGLRAGWRGRGLATRSVRLVADWAFTQGRDRSARTGRRRGQHRLPAGGGQSRLPARGHRPMRLPTSAGGRTDEARYGLMPPG